MGANRHRDSTAPYESASAQGLDPESPEFVDACLDLIKRSNARRSQLATDSPDNHLSESEANREADALSHQLGAMMADRDSDTAAFKEAARRELETAARRESEAVREAESLRHQLDAMISDRQSSNESLSDSTRLGLETSARSEAASVREAEALRQQLNAMVSDRDSDIAALREARRREAHVRAELETLQAELHTVKALYSDSIKALDAASQRATQARTEFTSAMAGVGDRDKAIDHLRLLITDRDREIDELQHRLLQAEEARIADASAILESLDKYRI